MIFYPKMNYGPEFSPLKDEQRVLEIVARIDGVPLRGLEKRLAADNYNLGFCSQVWMTPQINWDGKLLGCCVNSTTGLGNVFESGLEAAIESPAYRRLKRVLNGQEEAGPDVPCGSCVVYQKRLYPLYRRSFVVRKGLGRLLKGLRGNGAHASP
jgi:hypothetical protein